MGVQNKDCGAVTVSGDKDDGPGRTAAQRLAAIVESSADAIIGKTLDGTITDWNPAAERMYGYSADEAIGRPVTMLFPADRLDESTEILERVRRGERIQSLETNRVHKDGHVLEVSITVSPIHDEDRAVVGASTIARDVSRQRDAERGLRRLATIVESSGEALVTLELDGTVASWNRGADRTLGYSAEEMIGRSIARIAPPEVAGGLSERLQTIAAGGEVEDYETTWLHPNGTRIDILVTLSPIPDEDGTVVAAVAAARDITALRQTRESYRRLFEQHPVPMWIFDTETLAFLDVNEAAVAQYGWTREEMLAMTILDIRPEGDREAVRAAVTQTSETRDVGVWQHVRRDGSVREVAVVSAPIDFKGRAARTVLAEDVTDRRQLEERLRQSEKLEAIGHLAGGVAHDFNNVLMVVRACSALLLKKVDQEALRRDIVQIDEAAKRGAELTKQLLAFSKQQVMRPTLTNVNDVVRETLELLNKVIGENIEIALNLDPALPAVLVDRGQLGQVVINLAVNARDAMPHGGSLTMSTSVSTVDEATAARRAPVKAGRYVLLQITDTGVGMDEETSARAFDPFFTTKATGTGIGLPSVLGIVTQSGGHMSLYSEEGMGTTARIALPVAAGEAVPPPPAPPEQSLSGDETILLVEDDDVVRLLVGEALRDYGYTVLEASKGDAALELSRSRTGPIDLLLTDVVMPGMSGAELADLLSAERPGIALIFTSGYPANTVVQMGAAYLQKPYDPAELAATVRSALAGRGA